MQASKHWIFSRTSVATIVVFSFHRPFGVRNIKMEKFYRTNRKKDLLYVRCITHYGTFVSVHWLVQELQMTGNGCDIWFIIPGIPIKQSFRPIRQQRELYRTLRYQTVREIDDNLRSPVVLLFLRDINIVAKDFKAQLSSRSRSEFQ